MVRILVVDDNEDILFLYGVLLKHHESEVKLLSCPYRAIDEIINNHDNYDLVIVDYHMPNLNGVDILNCVRMFNTRLPVVLCSSVTHTVSGFTEMYMKPIDAFTISSMYDYGEIYSRQKSTLVF